MITFGNCKKHNFIRMTDWTRIFPVKPFKNAPRMKGVRTRSNLYGEVGGGHVQALAALRKLHAAPSFQPQRWR